MDDFQRTGGREMNEPPDTPLYTPEMSNRVAFATVALISGAILAATWSNREALKNFAKNLGKAI